MRPLGPGRMELVRLGRRRSLAPARCAGITLAVAPASVFPPLENDEPGDG